MFFTLNMVYGDEDINPISIACFAGDATAYAVGLLSLLAGSSGDAMRGLGKKDMSVLTAFYAWPVVFLGFVCIAEYTNIMGNYWIGLIGLAGVSASLILAVWACIILWRYDAGRMGDRRGE